MLRKSGETLTENISARFDAMLAKFGENIDAEIGSLNARVTALENSVTRDGRQVGPGPIKSIKPYSRHQTVDSPKISSDHV